MSTSITPDDVRTCAALARLGLSEEEITRATHDLANILEHFSSLQGIDTRQVGSASDITGLTNISRPDEVHMNQLGTPTDLLERAPDTHDDHLKVPAVF